MGQNLALRLVTCLVIVCSVGNTSSEEAIPTKSFKKCGLSFHKHMLGRLPEALQNCDSYEVGKKVEFNKADVFLWIKTDSARDCHIECFAHHECVAFSWYFYRNCLILKKNGTLVKGSKKAVYAMRDVCDENIDNDIKNYFLDPFPQNNAAKESFLQAKRSYNGTMESRKYYSRKTKCLKALIEYDAISEEEMGIAPALKENNEVPFLPLEGENPTSLNIDITANSGPQRIPGINQKVTYGNWIITGLYAPPGKIISVTSPKILLNSFTIKIGAHKDTLYNKKHWLNRDPDITMDFDITKENQAIGSPYGGLIFILFQKNNSFDGTTFKLKFNNVLKAPHFILGRDTNEDWNNRIKTEAIPWTVLEIPNKIIFIAPSRGEYGIQKVDDITFNLNEWNDYMDKNDEAAGIVDRPVAELIVIDSQISVGAAHNGYPIMKAKLKTPGFSEESINRVCFGGAIGHEMGHNMQLDPYLLHHGSVNLIQNYALPEVRKCRCGYWGRGSRLFSYVKAGIPVNFTNAPDDDTEFVDDESDIDTESDDEPSNPGVPVCVWEDVLKMSFDLGGSGWNDFPAVFGSYRKLPTRNKNATGPTWNRKEKMDLWVKTFCQVKKMNMLPFFQFFNFFSTESTKSICKGFSDTSTEIMSWISHLEKVAKEEKTCPGEGWFGNSEKCFKITEGKYNYQEAVSHCKGLGNSASLAQILGADDVNLVNYAFIKKIFKREQQRVWIQSVKNPSVLFPYAMKDYIEEPNTQLILGKKDYPKCSYYHIAKGKNRSCVGPASENPDMRYFALCEKPI